MKFACPESQNRVLLKCGSIASGSAAASDDALDASSVFGVPGGADGVAAAVESDAVCACAQVGGAAMVSMRIRPNDRNKVIVGARDRRDIAVPRLARSRFIIKRNSIPMS